MEFVRHSPSSLNLFCAAPAMFVLEKIVGRRQQVGAPAHRGTAVEDGVTAGLLNPDLPIAECVAVANKKYDTITALSPDARNAEFRATMPAMIEGALAELRPYGIPSACQGAVTWHPDDLRCPIFGYFDYHWDNLGVIVDLKTSATMPSQIKISHARQASFYAHCTAGDNADARIAYVTPKKKAVYGVENIRDHLDALHKIALSCERFLSLSEDPQFFVDLICPDYEAFYWGGPTRQIGYETWGF